MSVEELWKGDPKRDCRSTNSRSLQAVAGQTTVASDIAKIDTARSA